MRAADGKVDELRRGLLALIEPTAAEEGYVNYDLHESISEPGVFFFYENWDGADDLDAHLAARTWSTSRPGSPSCWTRTG